MDKFEEFKFFSERIEAMSVRRQTASQTYLTVNTAVFGVLALLAKDAGFHGWDLMFVSLPLFLVGVLACVVWEKIISRFKQVIGWHYEQLRDMERAMPDSYQMYCKEWERFYRPQRGKERFSFSQLEVWLPRSLLGLYLVYGLGMIAAILAGWL